MYRVLSFFFYRIRIFTKACSYLRIQISRATAKNKSSADESKSLTIHRTFSSLPTLTLFLSPKYIE